jgi:3-oxoacyl-[acyl-carrier-protein] synthase-3
MRSDSGVGILSIASYLPPAIRRNDWWPEAVVQTWRERIVARVFSSADKNEDPDTPGVRLVKEAMETVRADPFQGSVERRVVADAMASSDMEAEAGREAIRRAGIDPGEVDLLLVHSTTPDFLNVANACLVHEKLGLGRQCFSSSLEGMCNAFLLQLCLAEGSIRGGARYALLIQSSAMSRLVRVEDQHSPWFGDGATAVVVGPVGAGRGILGRGHLTDGSLYGGIVCGVPERRWHEGPVYAYLQSPAKARQMILLTADMGIEVVDKAMAQAGLRPEEIAFYASHQATLWFRKVTQQTLQLDRARSVDTFPFTASLSGSNIPFMLELGAGEGLLRSGDNVVMMSGAAGLTSSGVVLRWGT